MTVTRALAAPPGPARALRLPLVGCRSPASGAAAPQGRFMAYAGPADT